MQWKGRRRRMPMRLDWRRHKRWRPSQEQHPPKANWKGHGGGLTYNIICCNATEREYSSWPLWHAAILPGCSRQQHMAWILICDVGAKTIAFIARTKSWFPLGSRNTCMLHHRGRKSFRCCRQNCVQLCGTLKSKALVRSKLYCLSFLYLLLYAFFWQAKR